MTRPDATFLEFARTLKPSLGVPVIAVGRLGDPRAAQEAVAQGACDFVALGRHLLADADWARKVRAGEPVRRCIARNTCITGMRTGGPLYCLVNARTGRELDFADAKAPQDKRIAVVGAGPAGLTYATLVGGQNDVVVFEPEMQAGGALHQAALAPRFQEVETESGSLARYVAGLEEACARLGVRIQYGIDVSKDPEQLNGFDHVVVATGARYRMGLGRLVAALLETGVARSPGFKHLFERPSVRNYFYYRGRCATGAAIASLAQPGQSVAVIGDAAQPGKSAEAIASAFDAALRGSHGS